VHPLLKSIREKLDPQSRLLLRNTSWIFGSNLVRNGLVLIRSIVVARFLGLELFGAYAVISSFVVALQDFFNLNIGNAFIKFGAEYRTQNRIDRVVALMKGCLFATVLTALASLAVTAGLIAFSYDWIIDQPGMQWYIFLFAVSDVATFFDPVGKSILRLYYKFKLNSIIQTVTTVIEVAVICTTVVLLPENLGAFFVAVFAVKVVNLFVNNGIVFYELRHEIGPYLNVRLSVLADRRREIIRFVTGNSLSKSLLTLMNQGDTFLVGSLAGTVMGAHYHVAKRLANMFTSVTDPFTLSIYPQLSNLVAEGKAGEIRTMLGRLVRAAAWPALAVIAGVFVFNEWIVRILYGASYLAAAAPLRITAITAMLSAVYFWNQGLMLSLGLIRFRFFVYLFSLAGGVALAMWLVPMWQASGMAVVMLAVKGAITVAFVLASRRQLHRMSRTEIA